MGTAVDALILRCDRCGAQNRVAPERVARGEAPVCGRCGAPLPSSAGPVTVTDGTFAELVERSPAPVLLDLWAAWCGPCRTVAPIVDQLARELAGRVRVCKLNVDENPRTATRFDVRSIPTLLLLRGGLEIDRIVGAQPKSEILRRVQSALAA